MAVACRTLLTFLTLAFVVPYAAVAYHIAVLAADSGSHLLIASELSISLQNRGHAVTIIMGSNAKPPGAVKQSGITVEVYENPHPVVDSQQYIQAMQKSIFGESLREKISGFFGATSFMIQTCGKFLANTTFVNGLKSAQYDYAIIDPVCLGALQLPYMLHVPYSVILPYCFTWQRSIPNHPGFVPSPGLPYADVMTFPQRLLNTVSEGYMYIFDFLPANRTLMPSEFADLTTGQMLSRAELCLTVRNNILDFQRPQMSDVISMMTTMARPGQPLPADLDKFMNDSKNGVILVSFGSVMPGLPDKYLQEIIEGFRKMPYDIIFKYKGNTPPLPKNVRLMSWIPQNDLLAHPKLRLFVTHAGYNSLIEAAYHGVPVVLAPFTWDQPHNAAVAKSKGIGEVIDISSITSAAFAELVIKVIQTPSYLENARKLSNIFREVSGAGGTDPAFWVEHVIKYGASHLRSSGYDLAWYQYLMLDVYGAIMLCIVFLLLACKWLIQVVWRLVCKCGGKVKKD